MKQKHINIFFTRQQKATPPRQPEATPPKPKLKPKDEVSSKPKSITDEPLPSISNKIELERQTQPPPWSISNPIIEQSPYIPPF